MIGPVILGAALLYLLIAILVVRWSIRYARSRGKNPKRWGWGAALVMYLIPFWDWAPTVAMHQFYCAKESGFWVFKTLDQWKAENPGVLETLIDKNTSPDGAAPNWPTEDRLEMSVAHINQRFVIAYKNHLSSQAEHELFLHVWRWTYELLDKKTGQVLARQTDFSSGNGHIGGEPPMKFWLQSNHCPRAGEQSREFGEFIKQFRGSQR
jgi:hypothetical protein